MTTIPILYGVYLLCASIQKTCLQVNDGDQGSPLFASTYTGGPEQKWSIIPGVTSTGVSGYQIQNMRYNTYLNWAGGQVTGPGAVQQYVWQTSQRIIWEIKSGAQSTDNVNDDEGIPIIIGGSTTFQNAWNVMDGSSANNTPIIIWPLSSTFENSVFLAKLTTSNTAVSEFFNPTSATDLPSSLSPTNFRSSITTPTTTDSNNLLPLSTSPTTTIKSINTGHSSSSITSTPSTSATTSSSHGLPLDDRISLALGISFGIPTLILGIWGIWVTIRVAKGHYQRRKFKRLPITDSASGRHSNSTTRIRKQRDRRYFEMQRK